MFSKTHYGATYDTTPGKDFGKIITIFEVSEDWTGYSFHGYCRPTPQEVDDWLKEAKYETT